MANANIGFDAISPEDVRYQVKARRLTARNGSRQLGFIRGLDKGEDPFDLLVGILFDSDFTILRAALIPIEVIRANVARGIEAYPGLRFDRDMGAGVGPDGWLQEIEEFFEGQDTTG